MDIATPQPQIELSEIQIVFLPPNTTMCWIGQLNKMFKSGTETVFWHI